MLPRILFLFFLRFEEEDEITKENESKAFTRSKKSSMWFEPRFELFQGRLEFV